MYEVDFDSHGFEWTDCNDNESSAISSIRPAGGPDDRVVVVVVNWTPVVRYAYRVGVPEPGFYEERLNSDSFPYGGSNVGNAGGITAESMPAFGRPVSLSVTLPPLAALVFKRR